MGFMEQLEKYSFYRSKAAVLETLGKADSSKEYDAITKYLMLVDTVISSLPKDQKDILKAYYVEGKSVPDIAQEYFMSEGSVFRKKRQASDYITAMVDEDGEVLELPRDTGY